MRIKFYKQIVGECSRSFFSRDKLISLSYALTLTADILTMLELIIKLQKLIFLVLLHTVQSQVTERRGYPTGFGRIIKKFMQLGHFLF